MSFEKMKEQLLLEFRNNEAVWEDCADNKRQMHSQRFIIDEARDLSIAYPGYKTGRRKNGSIIYDYRVDFQGCPISHADLLC